MLPKPKSSRGQRKYVCSNTVALTPIREADPPSLYDPHEPAERPSYGVIANSAHWKHVRNSFVPLPKSERNNLAVAVCVPIYTEEGYTLTRTVQALALQRNDWHTAIENGVYKESLLKDFPRQPELHVLAIVDGYKVLHPDKKTTSNIMHDSMHDALKKLFGDDLNMADIEDMFRDGAEHVVIQKVRDVSHSEGNASSFYYNSPAAKQRNNTPITAAMRGNTSPSKVPQLPLGQERKVYRLAPVEVDCQLCLLSDARSNRDNQTAVSNTLPTSQELMEIRDRLHVADQKRIREEEAPHLAHVPSMRWMDGGYSYTAASDAIGNTTDRHANNTNRMASMTSRLGTLSDRRDSLSERQGGVSDRLAATLGGSDRVSVSESHAGSPRSTVSNLFSPRVDTVEDGFNMTEEETQTIYPIYVTVLIKRQNAKKHHSHRWFMEAFAPIQREYHGCKNLQYYFCTDVGTLYAPGMLARLWQHMAENKVCAACCAHQRIMSYSDQAPPDMAQAEGPFAGLLRRVQAFDFESGLAIFNGVHAALGYLPVVPGPCGFFRAEAISASILEDVRLICTNPSSKDGIIQGNLKIAEDRILSYLLLLVPGAEGLQYETHWVPSTVFFFESEDKMAEFVPQRRRWLNGTVAGYLWLLTNKKLWDGMLCLGVEDAQGRVWSDMRLMPWKVFFLSLLQLLIFVIVYLMPAFLPVTGHLALYGLFAVIDAWGFGAPYPLQNTIVVGFWLSYFGSFAALTLTSRWGKKAVYDWVWNFRIGINCFIMLLNAFVMISLVITSNLDPDSLSKNIPPDDLKDLNVAFAATVLYTTSPFLLTLMHSWASFKMMISSFPAYFVFLPTILSDFFAYSVARLDDWRWGTKSAAVSNVHENIADAKDQRDARSRLAAITNAAFGLQLVLGVGLALANVVLRDVVSHYLVAVGAFTAGVGLVTMALSFTYFFFRSLLLCLRCRVAADVPVVHGKRQVSCVYLCAGLADTLMKLTTFVCWVGAMLVMGFVAFEYASDNSVQNQAISLIFMFLALLVVTAIVRAILEKCRRMAIAEQAEQLQIRKQYGRDKLLGIEENRRRAFKLRGCSICWALFMSVVCLPFACVCVVFITPLNALAKICHAIADWFEWCCCPRVTRVQYATVSMVDEDEDEEVTTFPIADIMQFVTGSDKPAASEESGNDLATLPEMSHLLTARAPRLSSKFAGLTIAVDMPKSAR